MKIVGICGSQRKGNTEIMLRTTLNKAKALGAEVELILLREKNIEFCKGCEEYCSVHQDCKYKDDMEEIYKQLTSADCVVFGSPTYMDSVTGTLKNFMDRMDALLPGNSMKGKLAGIVVVGCKEAGLESKEQAVKYIASFCDIFSMQVVGHVIGIADAAGEIAEKKDILNECEKLANNIFNHLLEKSTGR